MKIRTGFVSNSSSSSFILAFNKDDKTVLSNKFGSYELSPLAIVDVFKALDIKSRYDDDTQIFQDEYDTIKKYYDEKNEEGYVSKEWIDSAYKFIGDNKDKSMIRVEVNYDDEFIIALMKKLIEQKLITVFDEDDRLND